MRYQIICVNKNQQGTIVSVGCSNGSTFTEQQVINKIASGDTYDGLTKTSAEIEVWEFKLNGHQFIKSAADHTPRNNLDNLPSC